MLISTFFSITTTLFFYCSAFFKGNFLNGIAEYYEDEYKDAEDWLKKAGSDEVEMYIENDYDLHAKYINSNEDILNEEYRISDVLDAYLAGTLVGKEKPKHLIDGKPTTLKSFANKTTETEGKASREIKRKTKIRNTVKYLPTNKIQLILHQMMKLQVKLKE